MPTLAAVVSIFAYGLMSPLLGVFLPAYALTSAQRGSLAFSNAFGLAVASFLAGPWAQVRGKKNIAMAGAGALAGTLFVLPHVRDYSGLLAIYLSLGISGGMLTIAANAVVSETAGARRGPALNLANLGFGAGGIITTCMASYVLAPVVLCYAIGGVATLALLLNTITAASDAEPRRAFRWAETCALISNPILRLLALMMFLYVACEVGVWNWLKTYLVGIGFEAQAAGGIVSYGFAAGMVIGRLAAVPVLKRLGNIRVLSAAGLLISLTTSAMLQARSAWAVTLTVLLAGLVMAPVFPTILALAGDRFRQSSAMAMGLITGCGWIGLAASSPVIGKMAEVKGLASALLLLPVLGISLVLVNLVLRARPERPEKHSIVGTR